MMLITGNYPEVFLFEVDESFDIQPVIYGYGRWGH